MRYYDLEVTHTNAAAKPLHYSSYPGGTYDPGALNVIFDLVTTVESLPAGASTIRVEGVDPTLLGNATQYSGANIVFRGGIYAGLPLANPQQAGMLVQGQIYQSFVNWVGTQVDLDFVVLGSPYTERDKGNIVLNWKAGTNLKDALKQTLQTAYPKATITMNIADDIRAWDVVHASYTLSGLATMLNENTTNHVQIVANGDAINVFDDRYKPTPIQIADTDFIGQPAWIDQNKIQIRAQLRSDIQVGVAIKMPKKLAQTQLFSEMTAAAMPSSIKYQLAVTGSFIVQQVRHVGNLRQPRGAAWSTIINAVPAAPGGASSSAS